MDSNSNSSSSSRFYELYGKIIAHDGVTPIPMALFRHQADLNLTTNELAFICYILTYRWIAGTIPYPSLSAMAAATGVPRRTLQRTKDSLVDKKYLNVVTRKDPKSGQMSNGYDFTPLFRKLDAIIQAQEKKNNGPKPANGIFYEESSTPLCQIVTGGCDNLTQACDTVSHKLDNNIVVVVTPPTPPGEQDEGAAKDKSIDQWTVEAIKAQVQAVAGAKIPTALAGKIMRQYQPEDLDRALEEMQRQLTDGSLIFQKGVGSWLQAALKEKWDKDTVPPSKGQSSSPGSRKRGRTRHQRSDPHEYLDPKSAARLEALREAETARKLQKELDDREERERKEKVLKTLYV